jgi:hypothetical protein
VVVLLSSDLREPAYKYAGTNVEHIAGREGHFLPTPVHRSIVLGKKWPRIASISIDGKSG